MRVLVTGSAGFIGAHMCARLAASDRIQVFGVDNLNTYYDIRLKQARLSDLAGAAEHACIDIADADGLMRLFAEIRPQVVIHLAAQAGVRHSFDAPMDYAHSNLTGQVSLLEAVRHCPSVRRMIYASSSSVYSGVEALPFDEDMALPTPKSLYAATKIADETLSRTYHALYQTDMIGLRFFTVYGPWGRPDMAYWKFAQAILEDQPIRLFNYGNVRRDFTYIDDVTTAIARMVDEVADGPALAPGHRVYNIGNHAPEPVGEMVEILEGLLGQSATVELAALPQGDMVETYASNTRLRTDYGFSPETPLADGLARFVDWYLAWRGRLAAG